MWFLKYFLWGSKAKGTKKKRDKRYYIKLALFVLAILALVYGCSTCGDCTAGKGKAVERIPSPVSNLSVVFIDGETRLFWTDSVDYNLDHFEVSWSPDGGEPVSVLKGIERYRIPVRLKEGVEYRFTVWAVDKWGNKSSAAAGGSGKGFWQKGPDNREPFGVKGTPIAEQVTLSWTIPEDCEYDYVEVRYDFDAETPDGQPAGNKAPDNGRPIRILKGVESKTLTNLVNGIEHTFYATAVDSKGTRTPLTQLGLYISDHVTTPESFVGRSSGSQVVLTWQDPVNSQFDYVEVSYTVNGGVVVGAAGSEKPIVVEKGTQTAAFTGFSDVTDYEFSVYVVDAAGHRRPLTNVKLLTPEIPRFDGRDAGQMVVRGIPVAGQVTLNWDDPEMADLDHVTIMYETFGDFNPDWDLVADKKGGSVTAEAGRGIRTVYGLADGKEYFFLAYGVDKEGNNRVITGLQLTTPELPRLIARSVSGKATMLWSTPPDPALSYYEVSYSPDGAIPDRVPRGIESFVFDELSDNKEYEFKITATASTGNTYAVIARMVVPQLSVITGTPVNRQLSLSWVDPAGIDFDHIEIVYSPGGEKAQVVAKGVESRTFYNLIGDQYTFTIYARDSAGNRHAVESAKFFDPRTAFVVQHESAAPEKVGDLKPLNWKAANSAAVFGESSVNAIAFGVTSNGTARWVAGGGEGKIAYSNDYGVNWTQVTDSAFGFYSVDAIGYGNGRWIAVGKNGRIAWSPNGATWNAATKTQTVNNNINAVAFGDGRWMAGANDGVILSSEDNGATWRVVSTDVFGRSSVNTIVYNNGRWMAGGAGGKIAYSNNNGISWTAVANSTFGNSAVNVIIYDKERWLAGGYAQRAAWSEDGITWKALARPFFILCLGTNGHRWIAGGQDGRMAWSGDGGDNWVSDEQGQTFFGASWVQAAASGRNPNNGRRWLSGGQNGKIIFADEQF